MRTHLNYALLCAIPGAKIHPDPSHREGILPCENDKSHNAKNTLNDQNQDKFWPQGHAEQRISSKDWCCLMPQDVHQARCNESDCADNWRLQYHHFASLRTALAMRLQHCNCIGSPEDVCHVFIICDSA